MVTLKMENRWQFFMIIKKKFLQIIKIIKILPFAGFGPMKKRKKEENMFLKETIVLELIIGLKLFNFINIIFNGFDIFTLTLFNLNNKGC